MIYVIFQSLSNLIQVSSAIICVLMQICLALITLQKHAHAIYRKYFGCKNENIL